MSARRSFRTVLTSCCFVLSLLLQATANTADEYRTYIDDVIPLTFDAASATAQIRELEVFLAVSSSAQQGISAATDAAVSIAILLPLVRSQKDFAAHNVSAKESIKQFLIVGQLRDQVRNLNKHLV